jgi:hypothetical protein
MLKVCNAKIELDFFSGRMLEANDAKEKGARFNPKNMQAPNLKALIVYYGHCVCSSQCAASSA